MCCHGNDLLYPQMGKNKSVLPARNGFLTDSHEILHRCLSWDVDMQNTYFDSGNTCVAMVTAYFMSKNG